MLSFIASWNTCGRTVAVSCPRIRDACAPFSPVAFCSVDDGIRHLQHNVGRRHVPAAPALTLYTADTSLVQCAAIFQALRDHEEALSLTGELDGAACFWGDVLICAPFTADDDVRRMVPSNWLCWRVFSTDDGREWYCYARGARALNPQVSYLCAHTDVPLVVAQDVTHDWKNATQRWGAFAHLCVELEITLWNHWPNANRPALLSEMLSLPQLHEFFDDDTIATLRVMCLPEGLNLRNLVLHGFVDEETLPPAWLEWLSSVLCNHKLQRKQKAIAQEREDVRVKGTARWTFDFDLAPWRQAPPSVFPFGREKIVKEAWRFWREGDCYRALLHLLPVLEMGLRRRFARVNNSANHGCAMHREYYTTLDGHGQRSKHQLLLASQYGFAENALVRTFSPGQLALLRDLFQQELGPNIRAQVIHKGVADTASCDACFLAYLSFCHEDYATAQVDGYNAQYDPLLLLRDAAQVPSLAILGAYESAERHCGRCPDARPAFTDAVSSLAHALAQHATIGRLHPAAVHPNARNESKSKQSRPHQCQEENNSMCTAGTQRASHRSDFDQCKGRVVNALVDVTAFVEAKSPFTVHRQTLMLIEKLCAAFLQRMRHLEELLDTGQARNAQRQQLSNLWVVRPVLVDFFTRSVQRLLEDCCDEKTEVPVKLCNAIGHFALVEKEGSKTNKGYDRAVVELAALVPRLGI